MAERAPSRFPDFFILGAPRCGTTFLYSALRAQPGIFMPERKEPRTLSPDIDAGNRAGERDRVRDMDAYLALFAPARPDQLTGEASPSYLWSRVAVPRILEANPTARLIVSLRDPIELMASMHGRWRAAGVEQLDLTSALRAEDDRATGTQATRMPVISGSPLYRGFAHFGEQLERLFQVVSRGQVLVLTLDDIAADPLAATTRVTRFLGVPDPTALHDPDRNGSRAPRSRALLEHVWTPTVIGRAKALVPRRLHPVAGRLADRALAWNRRPASRTSVPSELRAQLEAELRPDLELASRLLGEDLVSRWWSAAP